MKRRSSILPLAVLLLCTAVAGTPADAARKRHVRWWVTADYTWKTLAERFEKSHPNIEVQIVDGDMDKFYTMISAGLMPDVWGVFNTPGVTADVTRDWIIDLGPLIKRDGKAMKIDDFFDGVMAKFKIKGRQYSLPYFSYTDFYWYNPDMFARAGLQPPPLDASDKSWNWDKMLLYAQKTTLWNANNTMKQAGFEFGVYPFAVTPTWLRMWDVQLYSKEALKSSIPQTIDLDSPQMKTALTKMWELIYKNRVVAVGTKPFNTGQTAASIEPGWQVKHTLNLKKLKWKMAPLPWAVTNSGTLWPDGWRISKASKDKEAAWELIKFVSSQESQKFITSDPKSPYIGSPMTRKSVFYETLGRDIGRATGMDPDDVYKVHFQADAVGVVKEGETICLHTDLGRYLDPVMTDLWANKISPAQAAVKLQDTANKAMPVLFKRWLRNERYTGKEKK